MTPRYVTVSEMQDFLKCRWRWYARWVLNRVPRRWSDALILGTAVHDVFEWYFSQRQVTIDQAHEMVDYALQGRIVVARDPSEVVALVKARKEFRAYRPQIVAFQEKFPGETLAVEQAFEMPLRSGWVLRGRPDRVLEYKGEVYHMQHKTLAKNKSVGTFQVLVARSMHEGLYGSHLAEKYDAPYGGTILNVVRKAVPTEKVGPAGLSFQTIIPVDDIARQRAVMRAKAIVREMLLAEGTAFNHGHHALIDNPQEDGGHFGNSLDGYLPVLQGRASLDDDTLFMAREETYA